MAKNLAPRQAQEVFRSEGGRIDVWSSDFEIMKVANVCAARMVLHPSGLAVPKYSDSAQIYYIIEGSGRAGVMFPGSEIEHVKKVTHGDVLAIPEGTINWWYNEGKADLIILSLGETSKGHLRGQCTNFYLLGSNGDNDNQGMLHGFSAEFVAHAWDIDEPTAKKLVQAQKGAVIVKLSEAIQFLDSSNDKTDAGYEEFIYNVEDAELDIDVTNGGRVAVLTSEKLPLLKKLGLGADLVKLDPGAMCSPGFSSDAAYQVTYIVRGSGKVEVVSNGGLRVIDTELKAGDFFIVPPFFIVSKIAGKEGMEWFSIITSENPVFANLGGKTSVFKSLSPQIMSAALNIPQDFEQKLRSLRANDAVFFPPATS